MQCRGEDLYPAPDASVNDEGFALPMGPTKRPRDEVGDAAADASAEAPSSASGAPKRSRAESGHDGAPAAASKGVARTASGPTHVYVSCFDEPGQLHEVELKRLREVNCRLYCHIAYDPPDGVCRHTHRKFWRCSMTRKMLQTFVRSLTLGYLSRSDGVSLEEAYSTFEYENVHLGVPNDRANEIRGIKHPPAGVAFPKRQERLRDEITRLCEEVAHALSLWPRLEGALDAALRGGTAALGSASPTHAWVRFVPKPTVVSNHDDPIAELASKQPRWLNHSLVVIGMTFHELAERGEIDAIVRDEASYTKLANAIEARTNGSHFLSTWDVPRHLHTDSYRRKWGVATRWAQDVRLAVATQGVPALPVASARTPSVAELFRRGSKDSNTRLQYARAVVGLAEQMLLHSAAPATVFCNLSDNAMLTWERRMLAKALETRGIQVVEWSALPPARQTPLRFPPHWSEATSGSVDGEVSVLLDFSGCGR